MNLNKYHINWQLTGSEASIIKINKVLKKLTGDDILVKNLCDLSIPSCEIGKFWTHPYSEGDYILNFALMIKFWDKGNIEKIDIALGKFFYELILNEISLDDFTNIEVEETQSVVMSSNFCLGSDVKKLLYEKYGREKPI